MSLIQKELESLKLHLNKMFILVISQIENSQKAFISGDKQLSESIKENEIIVNEIEVNIDSECENVIALFNPVAADLRFVLSCLKINSFLERIGDAASGLAKFVNRNDIEDYKEYLEITQANQMFEQSKLMLMLTFKAFQNDDSVTARGVFKLNKILDNYNSTARSSISLNIKSNPEKAEMAIIFLSAIRKLSRVGDQTTNISEEIIFYLEANNIRHKGLTS
jgi:phosphate transport system protein